MAKQTGKRLDHHYRTFEREGALAQKHVQCGVKEIRLGKACFYRMARAYADMLRTDQSGLVDLISSAGLTMDEWLDKWFMPLGTLGGDYRELLTAVDAGMTLKKYLSTTPGVFLARTRVKEHDRSQQAVPAAPSDNLSIKEQAAQWRARAQAFEAQLKDLRVRCRDAEQRAARLGKTVTKMQRELAKVTA